MSYRHLSILVIIVSLFVQTSLGSGFEGSITLIKQTFYDTTFYTFTVKDDLVRVDEKNTNLEVMQSLIIDLKDKKITALSPSQKMFTTIQRFDNKENSQKDFIVNKSENFKYIDGKKCYLWRVRNVNLNMEVSYWVFEADYSFFGEVMDILGHTQDYSRFCLYFDHIPNAQGYFPMVMEEKTLLRDRKMKVSVQCINRKKVDNNLFQVPNGFKYLRY